MIPRIGIWILTSPLMFFILLEIHPVHITSLNVRSNRVGHINSTPTNTNHTLVSIIDDMKVQKEHTIFRPVLAINNNET